MTQQSAPENRHMVEEIEIDAEIEAVWKALTDAAEVTRWFPLEAGTNPDGTVWMSFGEEFRFTSRVEVSEPPRRLRSVPVFPPGMEPPFPMATEVTLETRKGKTFVRLVQSGFGSGAGWDEEYDATRRGWRFQLRGLRHYLEQHRGTPRVVAWARAKHSLSRSEAWERLMSRRGLLASGSLDGLEVGGSFALRSPTGDALSGTVVTYLPHFELSGSVSNLNNGFLRIMLDDLPMRGYRDVNIILSAYGMKEGEVKELEKRWQGMLNELFPP